MLHYLSLFFILYLPFQMALNPAEGIDLASARILAIFIFIFWLIQSLKNKKLYLPNNLQTILLLSFIFLAGFSILFAGNTGWAWKKMLFLLSFWPLYFVFADFSREPQKYRQMIRFLIYSGALTAVVALVQFGLQFIIGLDATLNLWQKIIPLFLGESFSQSVLTHSSWLVDTNGQTVFRAIAFFPDPHMLSLFLGLIFPWSVIFAFQKIISKEKNGIIFLLISSVILLADLLTFSRGGYLGLIGGILFASFFLIRKYRHKYTRAFLVLFFVIIASFFIPNPLSQRLATSLNPAEGSNQERLKNWEEALAIIQNQPLTGAGLGNYSLAVLPSAEYRDPIYAHNLYLDIAAETGIFNGIIFVALLLSSIYAFAKKAKADIFYLGGILGLIVFAIHSIFETGLYSVQVLPVLVIIIALSATTQKDAQKNN